MDRLARRLSEAIGARFVAVAVFWFSGYFISRLDTGIVLFALTAAWLPWIVDLAVSWTQTPSLRTALWLAAALAMQLLSGAPQVHFYTWLALIVWLAIGLRRAKDRPEEAAGF